MPEPDLVKEEIFEVYSEGLCYSSVCSNLPQETVEARMKARFTGVTPWHLDGAGKFNSGEPNPCQCPDKPTCKHYLFSC